MSSFEIPLLRGDRIILRAHKTEDFMPALEMWSDEATTRYIHNTPLSRHATWMKIIRFTGLWAFLGYGDWAIEHAETGEYIGQAGFADFKRDLKPFLPIMPEAGWAIHPAFGGKGYATEAMHTAFEWFDNALFYKRSFCLIHPDNAASFRVAEKLGFRDLHHVDLGLDTTVALIRHRTTE